MVGTEKPGGPAGVNKPSGKFQRSDSRRRCRFILIVGTVVGKGVDGMMKKTTDRNPTGKSGYKEKNVIRV